MRRFSLAAALLPVAAAAVTLALAIVRSFEMERFGQPVYDSSRFHFSQLHGAAITNPTVLRFGPDGALYVATRAGLIHRFTVAPHGAGFRVQTAQTIESILEIPNHDDAGRLESRLRGRLITGLAVTGSAGRPVLYIASSDPRIERPAIDTNSGVLSRLELTSEGWRRTDLVRGLPRSRNDHAPNGIALDRTGNTLYLSVGSMTNMGAPSAPFLSLPEYPLAASILAVNLAAIGGATLDLPTLGDPARPGIRDENDPFGGAGGRNQATAPPGGRIRLYAEGLRNAYSLLMTPLGMFTIDNGSNDGYGGPPGNPARPSLEEVVEGGEQRRNPLFWIAGPGRYFGHVNPSRPLPASEPEPPLRTFRYSTNGLALYSYEPDRRRMELAAVGLDRTLSLLELDTSGPHFLARRILLANFGGMPLDVCVRGEATGSGRTIWIADMGQSSIFVLAPALPAAAWYSPLLRKPVQTLAARLLLWRMSLREDMVDTAAHLRRRLRGLWL